MMAKKKKKRKKSLEGPEDKVEIKAKIEKGEKKQNQKISSAGIILYNNKSSRKKLRRKVKEITE